jgi:DNA-binding NarL/FixJ family response regulator
MTDKITRPMNKPTILIVEDLEATRIRIEQAVTSCDHFNVTGSVNKFADAVKFIQLTPPDILLTDLDLPDGNGIDLIKMVQAPEIKTSLSIVISVFGDGEHVINALKAGASGYLLKDDDYIEICDAITMMINGGAPISPNIARYLLSELALSASDSDSPSKKESSILSPREVEVLTLVSKGYTSREISEMLNLSYHTIREYVSNIYKKLSVKNRTQAVYEAKQMGLI